MMSLDDQLHALGSSWRGMALEPITHARATVLAQIDRQRRKRLLGLLSVFAVVGLLVLAIIYDAYAPATVTVTTKPMAATDVAAHASDGVAVEMPTNDTPGTAVQPPSVVLRKDGHPPTAEVVTTIAVSNPSFEAEYRRLMEQADRIRATDPAGALKLYQGAARLSNSVGAGEHEVKARDAATALGSEVR